MTKSSKRKPGVQTILGLVILAIIIICVVKLIKWNRSSVHVDTDVEEGYYDMECLDFYVYPDEEARANHPDNGKLDILILGNSYANNKGAKVSIVNEMRDKMDAHIVDLSADNTFLASNVPQNSPTYDCLSLYHQITDIHNHDLTYIEGGEDAFSTTKRYKEYVKDFKKTDFNDFDIVLIMYNLNDFYAAKPTLALNEEDVRGYHGSLYTSIKFLQDNYPHLQIMLVSPYPEYLVTDEGIQLSNASDYGWGTSSVYIEHALAVATQLCVSYIDNYFYIINDENIEEYVSGFSLTDKGSVTLANHIISFIENDGLN